jgi:guanine deaminase
MTLCSSAWASDTASLDGFGLLSPRTILAHGNFVSDEDMEAIGLRGSGIAHCPLSNFYLSNAVFPLRRALDKGLHVGLGTDISGGHSASILEACRHALVASRALEEGTDPAPLPRRAAGRARASTSSRHSGWPPPGAGRLWACRSAASSPATASTPCWSTPMSDSNVRIFEGIDCHEDVFQKIVYNAQRANIRKVWVEGRLVVDKTTVA